jgi:hypothetical protein
MQSFLAAGKAARKLSSILVDTSGYRERVC